MRRGLLFALTWPIRTWRRSAGRCPWCNAQLTDITVGGYVTQVFEHLRTQVRYCAAYHYFAYDSLVRNAVRTQYAFEDPGGALPGEAREVIDALAYAVERLAVCDRIHEWERVAAYNSAMDHAIKSCERLQNKLLGE